MFFYFIKTNIHFKWIYASMLFFPSSCDMAWRAESKVVRIPIKHLHYWSKLRLHKLRLPLYSGRMCPLSTSCTSRFLHPRLQSSSLSSWKKRFPWQHHWPWREILALEKKVSMGKTLSHINTNTLDALDELKKTTSKCEGIIGNICTPNIRTFLFQSHKINQK